MTIIQPIFIDKIVGFMNSEIQKGKVKLNGQYLDYEIHKTIKENNTLRKYLYLETEVGVVDEAQLLAQDGAILAIKPFDIKKTEDGLVLVFEFTVTVEGE